MQVSGPRGPELALSWKRTSYNMSAFEFELIKLLRGEAKRLQKTRNERRQQEVSFNKDWLRTCTNMWRNKPSKAQPVLFSRLHSQLWGHVWRLLSGPRRHRSGSVLRSVLLLRLGHAQLRHGGDQKPREVSVVSMLAQLAAPQYLFLPVHFSLISMVLN